MNKDGKVLSIYVSSNGYPRYMGKLLTDYYTDNKKVKALINMGYASRIGVNLEACDVIKRNGFGVDADLSNNLTEWLTQQGHEFNYVFYKGKWYAYEGKTPIDIETGEEVPPHELPGSTFTPSQTVKTKKVTYTWDDADRDMRKLLAAQKDLGPEQFGVKFYIGEEDGAFISFSNQPVRSFYVKKGTVEGQLFCVLLLPTSEFYKDAHLHANPKPQTMKHIRGVLYHQVNYVIQNL